eukprot:10423959-Prorocentrum_lima.AAC.1
MPFMRDAVVEVENELDLLKVGPGIFNGTSEWLMDPAEVRDQGLGTGGAALAVGVRYLPPQSLVEVYDFYCMVERSSSDRLASYD